MIKQENGKYVLYSKDGSKKLGTYDTMKEAEDREKQVNSFKKSTLFTVKTSLDKDGKMRWKATCSEASPDQSGEQTSLALFGDWIERAKSGVSVDWLPEPRVPFLGVSHYPDLNGLGEAGPTEKMYIDGKAFKANGTFYTDDNHPLGPILFEAINNDPALIQRGEVEKEIRISAAWYDLEHSHGDFIFERKGPDDTCPMCEEGKTVGKTYLKGQLDHFAATRHPMHLNTDISLEEKSAMPTQEEDAASIIGEELAKKLDEKAKPEQKAMVVKAEDETLVERAFTMADAVALRQAEKLESKVWSLFDLFMYVVDDIQYYAEPTEKVDLIMQAVGDFGAMVGDLKNNMPDMMAMMSNIKSEVKMSEQAQPIEKAETNELDAFAILKSKVDEAVASGGSREEKAAMIEPALKATVDHIRGQVDASVPVDTAALVSETVAKSLAPITEQLGLIAAQLRGQQVKPQQKSILPGQPQVVDPGNNGLAVSPVTGKPSVLTTMLRKGLKNGQY